MTDQIDDEFEQHQQEAEAEEVEEPVAAEEIAEEPKEEPKPESVPLATFLRMKEENAGLNTQVKSLSERLEQAVEKMEQAANPPAAAPDRNEDPFGALEHQVSAKLEAIDQKIDNTAQKYTEDQRQAQWNEAQKTVVAMEDQYADQNPDYRDAAKFYKELQFKYYDAIAEKSGGAFSAAEKEQAFNRQIQTKIVASLNQGMNPYMVIEEEAKLMGFKAKQNGNGETRDAGETLKAQAEKLVEAQTLASTGGKNADTRLTPAAAVDMDEDDFDKQFVGQDNEAAFKKLAGG